VLRGAACRPRGAPSPVIHGVDLEVPEGTSLVVLGGNGAGKSTLLRTAAGLLSPHAGEVLHFGKPVSGFDPEATALITEDPRRQFVAGTVSGEVEFSLESRITDPAGIRQRADAALGEMGIRALCDRDPLRLSAGEQQLALLAAALAPSPRLLILDDPFVYLDPGSAHTIWRVVAGLLARGRVAAVVLATHDVEMAAVADQVAVLDGGSVVARGRPEDVLRGSLPAALAIPVGVRIERALAATGGNLVPGGLDPEELGARLAWDSRTGPGSECCA